VMEEREYMKPGDIARALHVSPKTVVRRASAGHLPCIVTLGGHRRQDGSRHPRTLVARHPGREPGRARRRAATGGPAGPGGLFRPADGWDRANWPDRATSTTPDLADAGPGGRRTWRTGEPGGLLRPGGPATGRTAGPGGLSGPGGLRATGGALRGVGGARSYDRMP
jgi:hypothetical protein